MRDYATEHLSATIKMAWGREDAVQALDSSSRGFAVSFAALLIVWLLYIPYESASFVELANQGLDEGWSRGSFVFMRLLVSSISTLAGFVCVYLLCRTPETARAFPTYVIASNWFSLVTSAVMLPLFFVTMHVGDVGVGRLLGFTTFFLIGVILYSYWQITRLSLGLTHGTTFAYFVLPLTIQIIIEVGVSSLFNLPV